MSKWPTIIDPVADVDNLSTSMRAMKESMEIITGQRRGSLGVPLMYVQPQAPNASVSANGKANYLKTGDLWINTTNNTMSFYDGKTWQLIKTS